VSIGCVVGWSLKEGVIPGEEGRDSIGFDIDFTISGGAGPKI